MHLRNEIFTLKIFYKNVNLFINKTPPEYVFIYF